MNNMDVENPKDFQKAKRILTVVRLSQGAQKIEEMIEETNATFDICLVLAFFAE